MSDRPKNKPSELERMKDVKRKRSIQKIFAPVPVKRNRVMIEVHKRKGFACNPKYIVLKLKELYGDSLEIIWISDYPDTCGEVRDIGVSVLSYNSKEHFKKYLRTRVYVTNDMFPAWADHRKDQIWINTWHGAINYKHIGYNYLAPMSEVREELFRLKNRQADHYFAATRFFAEDTAESFNFDQKIFMNTGLPRNDIFFCDNEEVRKKVKARFGIQNEKKVVLFAPTFRKGRKSDVHGLDFDMLKQALSDRFGGEWETMFRNHGFIKRKAKEIDGVTDVSAYPDMNELLCAADVLISDYSSCMYDFSLQLKPCFVFANDIDKYMNEDRSFAFPIEKWPYSVATSNEKLCDNIRAFNESDYKEKLSKHFNEVGRYDDGNASLRAAELIGSYCGITDQL